MSTRKDRASSAEQVAGNGLLHRRALLRGGAVIAGAMTTGAASTGAAAEPRSRTIRGAWKPGRSSPVSGAVAVREGRRAHAAAIPITSSAIRTRARRIICCKARSRPTVLFFTICHSGLPDIDPAQHKLVIHGLVKQPLVYTVESLARYPMVTRMHFLECSGNSARRCSPTSRCRPRHRRCMASSPTRNGPACRSRRSLEETGIDPKAKWLLAEGADSLGLHRSVPIKKALDDAMIALYQNGERIDARQRLSDAPPASRLSRQHERQIRAADQADRSAGDELLRVQDLFADSAERQDVAVPLHPGGEIVHHASLVRACAERTRLLRYFRASPIRATGASPRSWSRPTAARAGRRQRCRSRCCRKRSPASACRGAGMGQPAVLQSRAWDEAGNVQPLRAEFVAARGQTEKPVATPLAFPNQHYNSITSWGIDSKGEIKHVYA